MTHDVVVLGMGLAGLCAALSAREEGATVALAGAGPGTLHLASGCIDVMAYPPDCAWGARARETGKASPAASPPVADPLETVGAIAGSIPDHPYAILGADRVAETLRWLAAHAEAGGWPLVGSGSANRTILTALGRFRATCLIPLSYAAGADLAPETPLLVAGISGLRDFSAAMVAKMLDARGYRVREDVLKGIPTGLQGHALGLARYLRTGGARAIGERIRAIARPGEIVGIPAILPPSPETKTFRELQQAAGAPVFEIPMLPPSLPGIRLAKALRARCLAVGVDLWEGVHAVGFETCEGKVSSLRLVAGPAPRRLAAKSFVLATGSFLSGGIRVDRDAVREPLFDLPIDRRDGDAPLWSPEFLGPGGHRAGKVGLAVDEKLRPFGRSDRREVAWTNLFAAGDLLAGHNPLLERSGGGVASTSGRVAGQNAARAAGCGGGGDAA